MIRNTASQTISARLNALADGTAVTSGTTTVFVTKDGATQATGAGTVTHEGNGEWSYVPTQAETDAVHVAFTFTNSLAVGTTVNVYTRPSGTGFPAVDTNTTRVLPYGHDSGTAQGGGTSQIQLQSGASSIDNFYNGSQVIITGGTGVGQSRTIIAYTGSTRQATVGRSWATAPNATSVYTVAPARTRTDSVGLTQVDVQRYNATSAATALVPADLRAISEITFASNRTPANSPTTTTFQVDSTDVLVAGFTSMEDIQGTVALVTGESPRVVESVAFVSGTTWTVTVDYPYPNTPGAGDVIFYKIPGVSMTSAGRVKRITTTDTATALGANAITPTAIQDAAFTDAKFGAAFLKSTSIENGAFVAGKFATDAFTAAKFAAGALNGKGDWNIGKTGYSLTVGTGLGNQTATFAGNLLGTVTTTGTVNNPVSLVNNAVNSNTFQSTFSLSTQNLTNAPTGSGGGASAASIADAVWDEVLSGHLTAGTTGAALNDAGGTNSGTGDASQATLLNVLKVVQANSDNG